VPPLGGLFPSCRFRRSSSLSRERSPAGSASGSCSPWKSVARRSAVHRPTARCPPGFSPLQGSRPSAVAHVSVMPPLSSLGRVRTGRPRKPAPQGLPEPKARPVSRETVDPLEVFDLFRSLTRSKTRADRAHFFAGDGMPRHRVTAPPPKVRFGLLPQPSEYPFRSTSCQLTLSRFHLFLAITALRRITRLNVLARTLDISGSVSFIT
jgi:hypothetical protein